MVFKKPYGFLIKHFKFIHLILTGLYIYLAINVSNILNYYNNFILGIVGKLDAAKYMNNYYMIVVILSIVICLIIYALLRYKKKPRALYLGLLAFVIFVAGMINMVQGGLEVIYFEVMDTKTLRLYRDLLRILVVFQYISIGIVLVRGLGFDIKKFNFVADMQELGLDVSDEEEVELTLGDTTNRAQRKFNRRLREFKYYYLENKYFILVILVVVFGLGAGTLFVKNEVIDKVYEQGESFSTEQFTFKVLDSFVTKKGYNNEVIAKEDEAFVIVRMNVASNGEKRKLNKANMLLEVNYNSYNSDSYYGDRFVDLGTSYRDQVIRGSYTYLFIYRVDANDVGKKMKLVYASDRKVNLSPVMLDEVGEENSYKLGDMIDFSKVIFGTGNLMIESFEVGEKFSYPYQYEIGGQTFNSQYTISSVQGVVLNLKIKAIYPINLDNFTFFDTYGVLKYKVDGKLYESKIFENKTPGNYKDGLYLAVDKKVGMAEEIWFDIQIRNYKYIYKIK